MKAELILRPKSAKTMLFYMFSYSLKKKERSRGEKENILWLLVAAAAAAAVYSCWNFFFFFALSQLGNDINEIFQKVISLWSNQDTQSCYLLKEQASSRYGFHILLT